ncbi:DUF1272 domain-containing protein [Pleionea litopenaei]|uniref:DUF1272 domain-containing protein n=1 Tax=Pleionea litopenaei TaxID=3070815 RepID=A0AA51RTU6_9GAMM|nr:DUF1272 domain-containing protein [Pleionea sp. HL-JVS1]WMS87591.1 DUF1272 domain-containing protein [Pleionea sp. HL-JVS1]
MLSIRPNCELCDKDLPANSTKAMICSYECTFCSDCVANTLLNVCPNCGGGFVSRPIRPIKDWRKGTGLTFHPASESRVHSPYKVNDLAEYNQNIKDIAPEKR